MNINLTCNAFWNGATVNFFRQGAGCGNTGEIAAIFDHEWGHGMDNNGVNPNISSPGEAIADIHAILRLNTSCIGRGFLQTGTCGGYGDACTACTGVRDIGLGAARLPRAAATASPASRHCPASARRAPATARRTAKAMIVAETGWDLSARDLRAAPFNFDLNTALELGHAPVLPRQRSRSTNWYQCAARAAAAPPPAAT